MSQNRGSLAPVLYLPHGGGPLPILGDESHASLVSFLAEIVGELSEPAAILAISAHWEEDRATVTSGSHPDLIYDYYGFPAEAYKIEYAAPGDPQLAEETVELIESAGIRAALDQRRGFDHGLFVPLKLMYPQADIPCLQLSLIENLNPEVHLALGKSIAALRNKGVLILGSGMSFHNLKAFFSPHIDYGNENDEFDRSLIETCTSNMITPEMREQRLLEWEKAPAARFCHPRAEHLLPLHACYGVAIAETATAEVVFNEEIMGKRVTGLLWR